MSADHFEIIMGLLRGRRPFRTFTVRLKSGERFEIDHPRAIRLVGSFGAFAAPGSIAIYFDHDSVSDIVDAPAGDIPNQPSTTLS